MNPIKLFSAINLFGLIVITPAFAQNGADLKNQALEIRKRIESGPPQFSLIGEIQRGKGSDYSINNEDFIIDSDTRISGDLEIGSFASVKGERLASRNYAKKIIIQDSSVKIPERNNPQNRQQESPSLGSGPLELKKIN